MAWLLGKLTETWMYESRDDSLRVHGIDLAREPDFDLGTLCVRPATCEVEWNGSSRGLQRRVMQVLVALAQERGSVVSQRQLVERCWRGLSVSDDAIYRCISKLRKLAANYPDPAFAIEAIPGVGYRLVSSDAARNGPDIESTSPRNHRVRALIAAAALLLLALAAAAFWIQHRSHDDQTLRVVVQPFEPLSRSDSARALASRIPNEVVDALGDSQIETVLAAAQVSDGAARSVTSNPGLRVTGILRDDGRNIIVDVRLEDGLTRAALWSTEFKRDRLEASDLPLEVAARIADVVNMIDFARHAAPPLTDDAALTALLHTTDMLRGANDDDWAPMLQNARDLVARHPEFAFGHSVLASAYAAAADSMNLPDRDRAMRNAARQQAGLTLKLDPEDAGAYAVLAALVEPYDHRRREVILLRGIKSAKHPKQPLAALFSYYGTLLGNVGRLREARSFQLIAQAADKWGPPRTAKLALVYANMGNLPAARDTLQKAVQLWPNHPGVLRTRQFIAGLYEPPAAAVDVFNRLDARNSFRDSDAVWRAFVEAKAAGSQEVVRATSLKIRAAAEQGTITRENEIVMLAGLGENKQAFVEANAALDHQQQLQPWFLFTPVTQNLRQDEAFVPLARRLGLITYWHETGQRPDFCTDPGRRSECSSKLLAALK